MKKATPFLAVLLSFAMCLPACSPDPRATPKAETKNQRPKITKINPGTDPGTFHAHLLSINDFHGQIDVTRKVDGRNAGRADYLTAYLKQRIQSYPDRIVLHVGDAVGASSPTSALLHD